MLRAAPAEHQAEFLEKVGESAKEYLKGTILGHE